MSASAITDLTVASYCIAKTRRKDWLRCKRFYAATDLEVVVISASALA